MQTSRNGIRMFCSIQNHIHTDTSSIKTIINHKSWHTSCHACLSSVFLVLLLMLMGLSPNWSYTWATDGTSTQTVLLLMPMGLSPNWSYTWVADGTSTQVVMTHPHDIILSVFGSPEPDFPGGDPFWYYSCRSTLNCRVLIGSWPSQL
jgi:hypothetical protein